MCTAFSYCRVHLQRLRAAGSYAPSASGSSGVGPWTLRPKRLQWLNHTITTGFKIAAFREGQPSGWSCSVSRLFPSIVTPAKAGARLSCALEREKRDPGPSRDDGQREGLWRNMKAIHAKALSLSAIYNSTLSICGLEAMAGTSPPLSLLHALYRKSRTTFAAHAVSFNCESEARLR